MYMCVRACVCVYVRALHIKCICVCVHVCVRVCVFLDGEGSRVVVSSIDGHVSDQLQWLSE